MRGAGTLIMLLGILAWTGSGAAQVNTVIARSAIIDGKIFAAGSGVDDMQRKVAEAAAKAPEKWDSKAQAIFQNMVFVSAVQIATLRAISDTGDVKLPIVVRPADMMAALVTWDTAIDNDCTTPQRIATKEVRLSDVILFTGDYEKLLKTTGSESGVVAAFRNHSVLAEYLEKVSQRVEKSGRRVLIQAALDSNYLRLQHFLLLIKADLLTQDNPSVVLTNAKNARAKMGLP